MQNRLFQEQLKNPTQKFLKKSIEKIKKDIALMKSDCYSLLLCPSYLVPEYGKEKYTFCFMIFCQTQCVQSLEKILKGEKITQADADLLLKIESLHRYQSLVTSSIQKIGLEEKPKAFTQDDEKFLKLTIEMINKSIQFIKEHYHYLAPENTMTCAILFQNRRLQSLAKILNNEKITQDDADLLLKMKEFQPCKLLIISRIEPINLEAFYQAQKDFFEFSVKGIRENINNFQGEIFSLKGMYAPAPEIKEEIAQLELSVSCQIKRIQSLEKMLNGEKITQSDADLLLKMKEFQLCEWVITSKIEPRHLKSFMP